MYLCKQRNHHQKNPASTYKHSACHHVELWILSSSEDLFMYSACAIVLNYERFCFVFWFCHDVELMNEDLFVHLILVDDSRVVLNEVEGEEGSDYINASYILVSKTVTKALKVTLKNFYSWLSWSQILSLIFKKRT